MLNRIVDYWTIHWKWMLGFSVLYGLIVELPSLLADLLLPKDSLWGLVIVLIMMVVTAPWVVNVYGMFLDLENGRETSIRKVLTLQYTTAGKSIVLILLEGLYIGLWCMLFIIPGIIKG